MDWFEAITGFEEVGYDSTRSRLSVEGEFLVSGANGSRHRIGQLELVTLRSLRDRSPPARQGGRRTTVKCVVGDARALHAQPRFAGATFQVASQFNLLEMLSPGITPEDGVTRYADDLTQGPACAMACGAGTIYRNYWVPVGDGFGQTAGRQLDALAPLGVALSERLGLPVERLWTMRNGYALCRAEGLAAIARYLRQAAEPQLDELRAHLAVGIHRHVAVTDVRGAEPPLVTQVYCSALPLAYSDIPAKAWEPFARLVLEAAYEATLLAAAEQQRSGGTSTVLLTRLGGGAFGNLDAWIDDAILYALSSRIELGLEVLLVSFSAVHPGFRRLAANWCREAQ